MNPDILMSPISQPAAEPAVDFGWSGKPRQMSTSSTRSNSRPAELHGPPAPGIKYEPVVYGEFLMRKVAANFGKTEKGKYD